MKRVWLFAALLIVACLPHVAHAHPGHAGHELESGFAHPFTGLDHLLAMFAVGLWAARIGGRALWQLPATFVLLMVCGGIAARVGVALPAVEPTIAASVLILGLVLTLWTRPPTWCAAVLVGLFAVSHGYAHMAELADGASPLAYAVGFVVATATVHGIGVAAGLAATRSPKFDLLRWAGAAVAACGLMLCAGVF